MGHYMFPIDILALASVKISTQIELPGSLLYTALYRSPCRIFKYVNSVSDLCRWVMLTRLRQQNVL